MRNVVEDDESGDNCLYLSRFIQHQLKKENLNCRLIACKKCNVEEDDPNNHTCLLLSEDFLIETSPINSFFTSDPNSKKFNKGSPSTLSVERSDNGSILISKGTPLMRLNLVSGLYDHLTREDQLQFFESILDGHTAGYVTRYPDGQVKFSFKMAINLEETRMILKAELRPQRKAKERMPTFTPVDVELSHSAEALWKNFTT
jgi:hypothetical protein